MTGFMKECLRSIEKSDGEIYEIMYGELLRQEKSIDLIASENFVGDDILSSLGSFLTNKYAEGYPSKRYYGGCSFVDKIEQIAIERLKKLFGAESANVQPHSGTQANTSVYFAMLSPGDTVLGMNLHSGGHLTHGSKINISGKYFNLREMALKYKPKMIVCGASAYSRIIDFDIFRKISDEVGSLLMVDISHIAGLIVAKLHPNPVPIADFVTSTTHKTLRGPRGGVIMCKKKYMLVVTLFLLIVALPMVETVSIKL